MFMSKCQNCGNEFEQSNKYRESKTCSKECRYALSGRSNKAVQGAQYLGRECSQCGSTFDGKTKHCSRTCSNKARSGDEHPARKSGRSRKERFCIVCGALTQHTQRATCPEHRRPQNPRQIASCPCGKPAKNIRSKYCSEEHRKRWGKKAPADTVTKICLGCGKEFTRYKNYPGKLKYCSNACAHREQKATTEVGALCENERTVIFRSSWEIRFWAACLRFDISIRSYDGPDISTSHGIYRPDFIVGVPDRIVDVKGWLRPESTLKIIEAREQGVDVFMFDRYALTHFEETGILKPAKDLSLA